MAFKSRPDSTRLSYIREVSYETLGGIENTTNLPALFALAWLAAGRAGSEKQVETPKGTVVVPEGFAWGSMASMQTDILASIGFRTTRSSLTNGLKKLERSGLIEDHGLVFPETRGRYGKLYKLTEAQTTHGVNVAKAFKLYYYDDPLQFKYGEIMSGELGNGARRGVYGKADFYQETISKNGHRTSAFISIGRWKIRHPDRNDPVYVPWLVFDFDAENLIDAYDEAVAAMSRLMADGADPSKIIVAYSGRRGFHVCVPMAMFGSPIFINAEAARYAVLELFDYYGDGQSDPCTSNVMQPIRVVGSPHEKTGNYKRAWLGSEFLGTSIDVLMDGITEFTPFYFPEVPDVVEYMKDAFEDSMIDAAEKYDAMISAAKRQGGRPSTKINTILKGVNREESWADEHAGRNKAAFVLACWLYEGKKTLDPAIDELPTVEAKMDEWNMRNNPPLGREMQSAMRSAQRTVS